MINNIVSFELAKYRKLWKKDRLLFSNKLVALIIKQNRVGLNEQEKQTLDIMEQVIEENNGAWEVDKIYNKKKWV